MLTTIENVDLGTIKAEMQRLLKDGIRNSEVRALATDITRPKDELASVFDWVRMNVRYIRDPYLGNGDLFISPVRQVRNYREGKQLMGDCDDHALLTAALLGSIGHKTRIVLLDTDFDNDLDHAIAQAWSDKLGWVNLDASSSKPLGWAIRSKVTVYVEPDW